MQRRRVSPKATEPADPMPRFAAAFGREAWPGGRESIARSVLQSVEQSVARSEARKDRLPLVVGAHRVKLLLEMRQLGRQLGEALFARNFGNAGAVQEIEEERIDVAHVRVGHELVHHPTDAEQLPETYSGGGIRRGPLPEQKPEENLPEQLDLLHNVAGREAPQERHVPVECRDLVNESLHLVPPGSQRRGQGAGHGMEQGLAERLDGSIFPVGPGSKLHAPPLGHVGRVGFEPVAKLDFTEIS